MKIAYKEIASEIKHLMIAVHEHVPKFYGLWEGTKAQHYRMVFELVDGEDLRKILNNIPIEEKLVIFYQIVEAVASLHTKKLFHRDIKPENIMYNKNSKCAKLIDFGTARIACHTITGTSKAVGSTPYMAPENFDVDIEVDDSSLKPFKISDKIDVWSLGCMLSEFLSGHLPWCTKHKKIIKENIISHHLMKKDKFPIPEEIKENHPQLYEIIVKCVDTDFKTRIGCEDLFKLIIAKID